MFVDSVCAREADDTAVESWYVPYTRECTRYVGWTRRQDGEAVVDGREVWLSLSFEKKSKTGTGVHNEGGGCGRHTKRAEG